MNMYFLSFWKELNVSKHKNSWAELADCKWMCFEIRYIKRKIFTSDPGLDYIKVSPKSKDLFSALKAFVHMNSPLQALDSILKTNVKVMWLLRRIGRVSSLICISYDPEPETSNLIFSAHSAPLTHLTSESFIFSYKTTTTTTTTTRQDVGHWHVVVVKKWNAAVTPTAAPPADHLAAVRVENKSTLQQWLTMTTCSDQVATVEINPFRVFLQNTITTAWQETMSCSRAAISLFHLEFSAITSVFIVPGCTN